MTSTAILCVLSACDGPSLSKRKMAIRPVSKTYDSNGERNTAELSNPLHRATAYWAREYQKNPKDANAGLSYARNLKALGSRKKAVAVLRQSHRYNPTDAAIASEYGRLVLADGNVKLAQQLLEHASAHGEPDWKLLSAQGTVHAKLGDHREAQRHYLAALQQKPESPSILNNLALSYAMDGQAEKAEELLRRAVKGGRDTPRVRQNLALVLGVQGKFDESEQLGGVDLSGEQVRKNVTYLRNMVRLGNAVADASGTAPADRPQATEKPVSLVAAAARQPAEAAWSPEYETARKPALRPAAQSADAKPQAAPMRPTNVAASPVTSSWTASVNKAPMVLKPSLQ